jgi:PAS domain S-box-containing protein
VNQITGAPGLDGVQSPERMSEASTIELPSPLDEETEASVAASPLEEALREVSNVGVFRADALGCCTSVNEHWCRITGFEREQVLGRAYVDVMPSEERSSLGDLWSALQAGRSYRRTQRHRRPDGSEVWIETQSLPEVDADGRVTGVITTLLDVTARRRAEEEARAGEERLRRRFAELESLYRHAPVGLSVVDRELRFVRVNERFAALNRRSVEEHLGQPMEEVVPGPVREHALRIARQVLRSGEAVEDLELTLRWRNAIDLTWLVSCHPIERDGKITGLLTVLQNVTQVKQTERKASEHLEELEAVIRHAPVALCLLDRDFHYLWVNETLARYNGQSVEAHLGASAQETVPQVSEEMASLAQRVFDTGEPLLEREVSGRPPGDPEHEYTWLLNLHPVRSGEGAARAVLLVLQDVTRLKRAQRELRKATERLEKAQHVSQVGSWEWNVLEDRIWWSDEFYLLLEKERRDFTPSLNAWLDMVHPEDRARVREQLDLALEQEHSAVQYRLVLDDGRVRPVLASARLERTPDGQPAKLVGTAQIAPEPFDPPTGPLQG